MTVSKYFRSKVESIETYFTLIRPERIFLYIALVYGLFIILVYPPFQGPDETSHFYRIYQLSNFKIISEKGERGLGGDYFKKSLIDTVQRSGQGVAFKKKLRVNIIENIELIKNPINDDRLVYQYLTASVYSPVPYIPQIIGVTISRLLFDSPIIMMYIGRIFNLIAWIIIVYFAIKILPLFKTVFILLALTPMSISQSATLSADVMTNGLSFLLIAFLLNIAYNDKKSIQKSDVLLLIIIGMSLALCKQIYLLLLFIYLIIPPEKAGSTRRYITIILLVGACGVMANTMWWYLVKDIMHANPFHENAQFISIDGQIRYILDDPLRYIGIVISTLVHKQLYHISFIGKLGWMDTRMPYFLIYSYLIVLLIASITEKSIIKIKNFDKSIFFLVSSAIICAVLTILYLSWSVVGDDSIRGVQGRYFIPFSPLVFILFYNNYFQNILKNKEGVKNALATLFLIFSAITTVGAIIQRYYI